ncbi:hypothetical protein U9M48_016915, partial [Paspalum notatum var. saurae]
MAADRSSDGRRSLDSVHTKTAADRWSALRAYRRAKGLCDKCAAKWSRDHKCADSVQLHVLQEVMELFQLEDGLELHSTATTDSEGEQLFLALSVDALSGSLSGMSFCLNGEIQQHAVLILVDSGSSHTFISSQLASRLTGINPVIVDLGVRVANGQVLQCTAQFSQLPWSAQGYSFHTDVKVLPLPTYDMILGLDWLESFSPMKVHWRHRWLSIPYQGSTALLTGIDAVLPQDSLIHIYSVDTSDEPTAPSALLPAVQELLDEFANLFAVPDSLPPSRACDHKIPLIPGAAPVNVRPYRFPPALKDEQVKEILDNGFIQKSTSPFYSSVLLVKKKDKTWRFCVDYRQLNAITVKGKYPVPIIDELLDELVHACWFSKLDLRSGFHQVHLHSGEEYKTAFQTHMGHYEFRVMPFGLTGRFRHTGAPGTFQDAMNSTLAPYLRQFVLVFFDDILIYSPSLEDHIIHLRLVFELLAQDSWKIKLSKCEFAQQQIQYLGHVVSAQGVSTDPSKVSAIASWPTPASVKELRSFLGLAGYYRKFVPHFGVIAQPLQALLKKHAVFVWTADHTASFQALQHALCSAPVLALPDFSLPFVIETDASGTGIGAVLMQRGHPIAYISKALGPRSQGLSTYEKEYMAILIAIQHWHKSLVQLSEQRLHTPWQQKVFTKLLGLQYKIVYKKGVDNRVADALSRHLEAPLTCAALSSVTPQWISPVQTGYSQDPETMDIMSKMSIDPQAIPGFELSNGLLKFQKRVWIGNNPELQQQLITACHSSALGGHSGIPVTYRRMKQMFAWKGMKWTVQDYVRTCPVCQQAKPDRTKLPGLLAPLPVPTNAWQVISMDFVERLPLTSHANCIMVIVDSFTKYAHFLPLRHPFTATSVAQLFLDNIYKLHGLPVSIISDRDRVFTSKFWRELFRLVDVQLQMSSSYHPQSDGQTERLNQTMETFLRCFANSCPSKWIKWRSLAEFWYNSSFHSAIGRSPFEALYGYPPKHFGISTADVVTVPDLDDWLTERRVMTDLIRQHLLRSKQRMKKQADKSRSERQFHEGDWVFLKLQPYVQSSLAPRSNQKLAFKYFGPFQIVARIGDVAYKLALPATTSIHPVFHVSQLKPASLRKSVSACPLPDEVDFPCVPQAILQRRSKLVGSDHIDQVLVQWSNWPKDLATWEDEVRCDRTFHLLLLGVKQVLKSGGMSGQPRRPILMIQ